MEHRFTDTQDGTLAGAWWTSNATAPELAWMFDATRHVLIVTAKTGTRTEHRIVGTRLSLDGGRRTFLPGLALHIGRRETQPRE